MEQRSKARVAVIGGGPAGLCAARHILSRYVGVTDPCLSKASTSAQNRRTHQFNTVVEKVKPISMETETGGAVTWEVISHSTCGDRNTQTFDSVFVCNGHYSDPHLPYIPGIEHFKGKVLHSHSYRYPEPFTNEFVVVLGARASSVDISIELVQVNAQPNDFHSSVEHKRCQFMLLGKVTDAVELQKMTKSTIKAVHLSDVQYSKRRLGLDVQDLFVTPQYKYLLPPGFPSIFFIGICKIICPFIHFDSQVRFSLAVLEGSVELPTQEEMEKEVQREMQRKQDTGVQVKHLLNLDKDQWEYYLDLAKVGRFTPPQLVFESLYEEVRRQAERPTEIQTDQL